MLNLILLWYKAMAANAAKKVLAPLFKNIVLNEILKGYWMRFKLLRKELKKEPTVGRTLIVHVSAMSTSFYQEPTGRGICAAKTTQYFYEIAWRVYKVTGKLSRNIKGLKYRRKSKRLAFATELFRSFHFNIPSYRWENIPQTHNSVCFNWTKYPSVEYFETKGLLKFCAETWCVLDFSLAAMWNSKLAHTNRIAGRAKICDFKWKLNN